MTNEYTAIIVKEGPWYCVTIAEVPGAISQAKTLEDIRENLKEAVQLVLEARRERALKECEGMEPILEKVAISV